MNSRDVTAKIRVSRFSKALSRVRRMSAEEKRLKTSSEDSGSSQNYHLRQLEENSPAWTEHTEVQ
jgi:hypothetical protein